MRKKMIIIGIIIILIISGYLIFSEQSTPKNNISQKPAKDKMDAEAKLEEAAMTIYSKDETTKWELSAQAIEHFTNSKQVNLQQVKASVYKNEKKVITLRANKGNLDLRTNFLSLTGPIRISSEDKVLEADKLNWNSAKNQLIGIGNILLKQNGLEITGEKLLVKLMLSNLEY